MKLFTNKKTKMNIFISLCKFIYINRNGEIDL